VDAEPSLTLVGNFLGNLLVPYQYYTCCPPDLPPSNFIVSRHCSNSSSIFINDANIAEEIDLIHNSTPICEDEKRPYPRKMANFGQMESFMCCDSIIEPTNNKTINFVDETECVPFSDVNYLPAIVGNSYGVIHPISCNNKGIYSQFQFPRRGDETNISGIYNYECCRTGSKTRPFRQNATFNWTLYPQIAVSIISVIFCMVLIIALLIPLGLYARKIYKKSSNTNTNTRLRVNRSKKTNASTDLPFSGYNLYLIYLAIPDMILNTYLLGMYSSYANQKYNPHLDGVIIHDRTVKSFEGAFVIACSTANLYLNCVVSYEVLILLRNSYNTTRCDPPSLVKVTLQAASVYSVAILVFITYYFIGRKQHESYYQGDFDKYYYLKDVSFYWSLVVTYLFPIIFFGYVWITIWFCGYMPSATGRMKELVWYFFRITIIFNAIWLPGMALIVIGAETTNKFTNFICIGYLFCGIQPIVSTCMAMTKSDVRKYARDLITLSYVRKASATS